MKKNFCHFENSVRFAMKAFSAFATKATEVFPSSLFVTEATEAFPPSLYVLLQRPFPPFWFSKNNVLEHRVSTRKLEIMQKEITFNPSYLTKISYISSILNFLITESLVVKVSNTKFNIQSLHR